MADRYHRTHTALNALHPVHAGDPARPWRINNAKAFADAQSALEKASLARLELEQHARDVQGAVEAHEQLTSLLAGGATLGELCQADRAAAAGQHAGAGRNAAGHCARGRAGLRGRRRADAY